MLFFWFLCLGGMIFGFNCVFVYVCFGVSYICLIRKRLGGVGWGVGCSFLEGWVIEGDGFNEVSE